MRQTNQKLFSLNMMCAVTTCAFIVQMLASCGTDNNAVSPSSSTTKLIIVNTSPDVGPLTAFINSYQLGNGTNVAVASRTYFRYSIAPVYYSIGTGLLTIQLRTDHNAPVIADTVNTVANRGYSLFLMGLNSIDSLSTVLVSDSSGIPALGNGKVRFLNASPRTPALDIYVNGTLGFPKVAYKKISNYVELPAGIYDFKMTASGSTSNVLTDLPRITIQDGKLYTLYSKGLAGRTDTAAISLNLITNK